ncbi:MAG: N-acetyltransferase [Chloroflexi bacterium]|nr:N-acetyltransferase [Chloroflexota bacterium]
MEIRAEEPEDIAAIRRAHQQAFHPSPNEACLVELLRQARKAPISLVALSEGQIVGHVLFSPIAIVPAPPASIRGLGLAPIGVLPAFQKQGIGSKLIEQGLRDCRRSGYDWVVVLGDPHFYSRFGFARARAYQLENEYDADEEFMVMELRTGALRGIKGMLKYRPEFNEAGC